MFQRTPSAIEQRLRKLERHLELENPVLLEVVKSFRVLDRVAHRLAMLTTAESFATRVPWWPLVSVLGTFSSGKSSFINSYLGQKLQLTGTQAVDDKFTVICYSSEDQNRVLPGLALDADPRFPFYQISRDIEKVAAGEGRRLDAYLQLKTSTSERLRGKILIDSPGFDADEQRTSILRITDHIVDLSDLVLVFFDARHPEPGAMHDTLEHLVANTIQRPDSSKFLYILNQIDVTAREDNPEEVFAAWQRALSQKGLTAGRFYRIYDPAAASPIENASLRARFESKRAEDVAEIHGRMHQVEVERAYRIIGVLEKTAKAIEHEVVPRVRRAIASWRRRVLWLDGVVFGLIVAVFLAWTVWAGYWHGFYFAPPWGAAIADNPFYLWSPVFVVVVLGCYVHFRFRKLAARRITNRLRTDRSLDNGMREWIARAFVRSTRPWRSIFLRDPAGWGQRARRRLVRVLAEADGYVQTLNDRFANPSGDSSPPPAAEPPAQSTGAEVREASAADESPNGSTSGSPDEVAEPTTRSQNLRNS